MCNNAVQGRLSENYCTKYFVHKIFVIYEKYSNLIDQLKFHYFMVVLVIIYYS